MRNIQFLVIAVVAIFLQSCENRITTYDPDTHTREIISDEGEFILADETIILPEETLQLLTAVSEDGITYTFESNDERLENLRNEQILIFGISDLTPYGALRRIIEIEKSDGRMTLVTEEVSLEETFEELFIESKVALTPDQIQKVTIEIPGMGVIKEYDQNELKKMAKATFLLSIEHKFYPLDTPILPDSSFYIKTTGSIEIAPEMDFLIEIRRFRLDQLRMVIENNIINQLKVEANFNNTIKRESIIFSYHFAPLIFGPVIFTPRIRIVVGVEGSVVLGVESDVGIEIDSRGGLHYQNGSWNRISEFDPDFTASMPDLFTNAFLRAYFGPRVDFYLYGVAGPYVNVNGFGEISVDTRRQPELQIHLGVEANAGAEMKLFSRTLAKVEVNDLFSIRRLIYEKSLRNLPSVTTSSVTNITSRTASSGGSITDSGGLNITARGVCWSREENPTTSDNCTTDGTGVGSFNSTLSNLLPDTQYFLRAYATNSSGTGYGNQQNFVTEKGIEDVPPEVNDFLTPEEKEILRNQGLEIFTGLNPPNIEGNYYANSLRTPDGNFSFMNYSYRYFNQSASLSIQSSHISEDGSDVSEGRGAFIAGNGNNFSVYMETISEIDQGTHVTRIESARIYSGTISSNGIADFQFGFIVTAKENDRDNRYMNVGDTRVIYESDGLAERVNQFPFKPKILASERGHTIYMIE